MFDFGILTLPIIGLATMLGFGIYNGAEIVVEPIKVPHALEDQGFSSAVVTRHLTDEVRRVGRVADSSIRTVDVDFEQADRSFNAVTDYFDVTHLVDAVRQTVGLVPYYFSGEMVLIGNDVEFRVRAYPYRGLVREFRHRAPLEKVDATIVAASFDMLKVIDPYLAGLYTRRTEEKEGSKDFPRTFAAIEYAATATSPADQHYVHNLWARTLLMAGRSDEALRVADAAIALKPDFANAYYSKAVILAAVGRPQEALPYFERAVNLRKGQGEIWVDYATTLEAIGRPDEAAALMRRANLEIPLDPDVHHYLGKLLVKQGKRDEAIVEFRQAMALADRNEKYFEDYRQALLSAGGKP